MKSILITFFITALSMQALAGAEATVQTKIERTATIRNSKNVFIYLDGNTEVNPAKCSKSDRLVASLGDDTYSNRIFTALMTAVTSKQTVKLYVLDDQCVTHGSYTYPMVHSIHQY